MQHLSSVLASDSGFESDRENAKTCDAVECPEGLPCEACGSSDYQRGTVQLDQQGNTASLCFALYSLRQAPVEDTTPADTTDGGVTTTPETDESTTTGSTDGTTATDAGNSDGSTDGTTDGTTTDAGTEVPFAPPMVLPLTLVLVVLMELPTVAPLPTQAALTVLALVPVTVLLQMPAQAALTALVMIPPQTQVNSQTF